MTKQMKHGDLITVDGEEWKVVAVGNTCDDATYVHLASTTRGAAQKNGFRPIQSCGWLRGETLSVNL